MNIYIIPNGLKSEIVKSQVIDRAKSFSAIYDTKYKFVSRGRFDSINGETISKISDYKTFNSFLVKGDVLYIRSFMDYIFLQPFRFLGIKMVYDFRGFVAYESYLKHKSIIKFLVVYFLEGICYLTATNIFTVSNQFSKTLKKKYLVKRKIHVIPSLISQKLVTSNNISIAESKNKFVYIGGLSKWQKVDEIIKIFDEISKSYDSTLDIITKDLNTANKLINSAKNKDKIRCFSIDQNDVMKTLINYDFGFLLRDNILLNNVASPVKFLEYCAAGVLPVISENVGDFSKLVIKEDIGLIYKNSTDDMVNQIEMIQNMRLKKQKLINFSQKYTWEKYLLENDFDIKI
ncbi:glycosyltransferase [Mesohalobacter halotolerans]|uniref:Glycosyltransferase family 4 protein n=1 Tax=Mesohalobacter halotolerans TaxID=1883405 RepID=A0A4V6ALI3_9FLAO|nr:glycosyltransferase [Mesohalobacter halotolerans]TKS56985.1 glycosyltransferase family 4 protein [Mesohalobacter halotolerans]